MIHASFGFFGNRPDAAIGNKIWLGIRGPIPCKLHTPMQHGSQQLSQANVQFQKLGSHGPGAPDVILMGAATLVSAFTGLLK